MNGAVARALARGLALLLAVVPSLACGSGRGGGEQGVADSLSARAAVANAREQGPIAQAPNTRAPRQGASPSVDGRAARDGARAGADDGAGDGFGAAVGFRSRARLREHFAKHGHEFGAISVDEYLRRAQSLRDARVGGGSEGADRGDVAELVRSDGVVSRFDRRSGAFIAFDRDGTIRTFFRPNDGEAYFRRQGRRRPMR